MIPVKIENNNNVPVVPPANLLLQTNANHPSVVNSDDLNQLSAQEDRTQQLANKALSPLVAIDTVMRKSIGLAVDVIEKQLEVIQSLLAQRPEDRNFDVVHTQLGEKLIKVRKDQYDDYCLLLGARETIWEDGREVPLTDAKKEALKREWIESMDQVLLAAEQDFNITAGTDLERLKLELEQMQSTKFEAYEQMMDSKTVLTNRIFQIQQAAHKVFKAKGEWFQVKANDLYSASASGNLEVLEQCINRFSFWNKKEGINALNKQGFGPIHLAVFNNQIEAMRLLLRNGANPCLLDVHGYQPIHWAAKKGFTEIVMELLAIAKPIDACGEYGRTPLHMAVFNSRPAVVECLLTHGAAINAQTSPEDASKTPLHDAVIRGDTRIVTCLVKSKELNVMICDKAGLTPLCHAVMDGHLEIASLIVGHRSWVPVQDSKNPNHKDNLLGLRVRQNEKRMKEFLETLFV